MIIQNTSARPLLLTMLLAVAPLAASAAGPVAPNAGSLLQQVQPITPPPPSSADTGLMVEPEKAGPLPDSAPFLVSALSLNGNTVFSTPFLIGLMGEVIGQRLTLSQLEQRVARITEYYHSHGYSLAQALIPAQVLSNGTVRIEVIEARYNKIKLDNTSRVRNILLEQSLAGLQSGNIIEQDALDHSLLLLSDISGASSNATLMPGEVSGTSDLLVKVTPVPLLNGSAVLDNTGNHYTGRPRASLNANANNALGLGDVLSVNLLSSGRGMNYGRVAEEVLLHGQGSRLGASFSALHYILSESFTSLNIHGTAQVASLWGKQTLVRSRDVNLYAQVQYDNMQLRDHIDVGSLKTDRHVGLWAATLTGDVRDNFLGGGISSWNVAGSAGRIGFDDAPAELNDAATAKTEGKFAKWNLNAQRLQQLTAKDELYLSVSMQGANANLDSSQKFSLGGPSSVRAYDVGAISGDTGYWATVELRHDLGAMLTGQWRVLGFIDSGRLTVNKAVWIGGVNSASLHGAGLGLNWAGPNLWNAKLLLATRLGAAPEQLIGSSKHRGWVELNKSF